MTPLLAVVDDDISVRESLESLIRSAGMAVSVFGSAEEFLDSAQPNKLDCLILDVRMPGMSGIELLETMRRRGDLHPVIVISGRTDPWTRKRAHAAGALAILDKPYQVKEVLELLRAASDRD